MLTMSALAFSGPVGSGKTSIAVAMAAALDWKFASFGNVVRREASKRGLNPQSRETLQKLGLSLIGEGWRGFCQAVLEDANWRLGEGLVVDGIRHIEALDTLRVLVSPLPLLLIYVQVDEETRRTRLRKRNSRDDEVDRIDEHETESQVRKVLFGAADLTIDNALPTHIAVERILVWLNKVQEVNP